MIKYLHIFIISELFLQEKAHNFKQMFCISTMHLKVKYIQAIDGLDI